MFCLTLKPSSDKSKPKVLPKCTSHWQNGTCYQLCHLLTIFTQFLHVHALIKPSKVILTSTVSPTPPSQKSHLLQYFYFFFNLYFFGKILQEPSLEWRTEFCSLTAKSSPRLSDTTFFAHCIPMLKIMMVMMLFLWYNVGAFFKEQLWNTIRFLIALFLILSLIEAQLQMKSEYQAKRKTICKTFS